MDDIVSEAGSADPVGRQQMAEARASVDSVACSMAHRSSSRWAFPLQDLVHYRRSRNSPADGTVACLLPTRTHYAVEVVPSASLVETDAEAEAALRSDDRTPHAW